MDHAYMMIDYLVRRGGKVTLEPIADVPAEWDSPQEAFADTLAHEEKVTSMINALYAAAEAEHDLMPPAEMLKLVRGRTGGRGRQRPRHP